MAAVVVAPSRHTHPTRIGPHAVSGPSRPPLQVIPGGRRAARQHAAAQRPAHRLHPAVYRRRRLGAVLAVATFVVVGYLAFTGARVLTADAGAAPAVATATPTVAVPGPVYVVQPGDTLWSIARSLQPSGDVRQLVDQLSDQVGHGPLVAGQTLRVDGLGG